MKDYRAKGIETYGDKCEICGHSMIEVHHIDYQEQQNMEERLRHATRNHTDTDFLKREARSKGYGDFVNGQLSKNDDSTNLAVLCGNCHSLIHRLDVGMKI